MRFARAEKIVVFEKKVIDSLKMQKQKYFWSPESGGQLFGKICSNTLTVCHATAPSKADKRGRFFFQPSAQLEQIEIENMYSKGFHYLGDWHSHPEKFPTPSALDHETIQECFRASKHELNYFLLVIVGTADFPQGLFVSCVNGIELFEIPPIDA